MNRRPIGIVLNGVTGRMGYRQHLVRSLLAIRAGGGLPLADGTLPHRRYLLENLFGRARAVQCVVATHIDRRWDEHGVAYRASAEDVAYADDEAYGNGFREQWEDFLRHVVESGPFGLDFAAGARGVQFAELGLPAAREGRRVEVPELVGA